MRSKGTLIFVCLFSLVCACTTDDGDDFKKYFIKYYGMDGDHEAADMTVNADGTILLLGTTEFPANSGTRSIYLVKIDHEGNTLWEKTLGEFAENAKDIEPITAGFYTGGYLILSNTIIDAVTGNTAIKVLRVDANGDKIDSLFLDNEYLPSNYGSSITALSDGGIIITGNTKDITLLPGDDTPPDQTDLLTLRYDETLTLDPIFPKTYGGEPEAMGIKMFEVSLNEFYFAGYTNALIGEAATPPSNFDFNFWYYSLVVSDGDLEEFHDGISTEQEKMNAIAKTPFGEYFAVGTVSQASGTDHIFASRIVGNFSNADLYDVRNDMDGEGVAVAPADGSQILIVGNKVTSGGSRDIWVTKVSRDFVDQPGFPMTFGASGNDDTGSAVAELPDGKILILGTMNLVNQKKIALIKVSADGSFAP